MAGEIIGRFERKGFKLVAVKFVHLSEEQARQLYRVHRKKEFYEPLVAYVCSAPVLMMVWEAEGVIEIARRMIGATFGYDAEPGTIRGDFGCSQRYNLVHGSDSPESAEEEIRLFFKPEEVLNYSLADAELLYGKKDRRGESR